jgi:hypothetical protein
MRALPGPVSRRAAFVYFLFAVIPAKAGICLNHLFVNPAVGLTPCYPHQSCYFKYRNTAKVMGNSTPFLSPGSLYLKTSHKFNPIPSFCKIFYSSPSSAFREITSYIRAAIPSPQREDGEKAYLMVRGLLTFNTLPNVLPATLIAYGKKVEVEVEVETNKLIK